MQAVLFITGLGGKASFWSRQAAALAPRFTALTYDLRSRSTVQDLARDAVRLLAYNTLLTQFLEKVQ